MTAGIGRQNWLHPLSFQVRMFGQQAASPSSPSISRTSPEFLPLPSAPSEQAPLDANRTSLQLCPTKCVPPGRTRCLTFHPKPLSLPEKKLNIRYVGLLLPTQLKRGVCLSYVLLKMASPTASGWRFDLCPVSYVQFFCISLSRTFF